MTEAIIYERWSEEAVGTDTEKIGYLPQYGIVFAYKRVDMIDKVVAHFEVHDEEWVKVDRVILDIEAVNDLVQIARMNRDISRLARRVRPDVTDALGMALANRSRYDNRMESRYDNRML